MIKFIHNESKTSQNLIAIDNALCQTLKWYLVKFISFPENGKIWCAY